MPKTLKRYSTIRRADNLDDQKLSAAIASALAASETQEDLQEYLLSRLRQVIFGDAAGHHWYDDFGSSGILSLKAITEALSGPGSNVARVRTGIDLFGVKNGSNRVFTTGGDVFLHEPDGRTIQVWHNGRLLSQAPAPSPAFGDYSISESAGPGTGFDTITLLTFAPIDRSKLTASYQLAL